MTSIAPFRIDDQGKPLDAISCALDITHEKNLQKDLEKSNKALIRERENLMRSNRDLEVFAALAAHDLKSPLQSAMSWLSHLTNQIEDTQNPDTTNSLEIIRKNIGKSVSYINDLLTISRLNSDHAPHVNFNLKDIVDDILCIHSADIAKNNATIKVGLLPQLFGNPQQIESVLSNLLRNALFYKSQNKKTIVEVGSEEDDHHVTIFVKDNGPGIPKEKLNDIFNLFERLDTESNEAGTGMGLAYCRKVINLHNGEIWADSQPGGGTTIRFSIPKASSLDSEESTPTAAKRYDHLGLDPNPPISQYVYCL